MSDVAWRLLVLDHPGAMPRHGAQILAYWRSDIGCGYVTGIYHATAPASIVDAEKVAHLIRQFTHYAYVEAPRATL